MADPESASTDLANFPALMAQRAQLVECLLCNKKVPEVFAVTAEDIQREKPPFWGIRVCSNCLARLRADARLESNYHSRRAVLELSLFVSWVSQL